MSMIKSRPVSNQPFTARTQNTTHQNSMVSAKNPLMTARNDFKTPRQNALKLHPFPKTTTLKEWSKPHLLTLRKSIEESCWANTKVKQELKMQKENSHQVLSQIKSLMIETEQSGIDLVSKYEQEKCKHSYLVKLVNHYQAEIESQKQGEHQKLLEKIQLNDYDQLCMELRQKQKLLEKITNKLNSFLCEKTSKYEIVKAQRRERTVFSNQFNKFENQIFSLTQRYKQSVIERVLLEQHFKQSKEEFLKVQNEWKKHIDLIDQARNKKMKIHNRQIIDEGEQYDGKYEEFSPGLMIEPSLFKSRSKMNYTKMEKTELVSKNQLSEITEKKLLNLEFKKKIQLLMNDFGVNHVMEIQQCVKKSPQSDYSYESQNNERHTNFSDCLPTVELINRQKNQQLEKLQDTISEWQVKISELKKIVKLAQQPHKLSKQHKLKLKTTKQKKLQLSSVSQNLHSTNQEIASFSSSPSMQSLIKMLNLQPDSFSSSQDQSESFQIDLTTVSQIDQSLSSLLDKSNLQGLKPKQKQVKIQKSFLFESIFTQPQQKQSLVPSQRTICPILQSNKPQSKRTKTIASQHLVGQPLKKLSSLLRNQSRVKGPTDIASKDQMIKEATQAFGKEGIIRPQKFQVRYS